MLEKPSLRVLRWDYEAAKQAENEVLQERMNSAPTGRRHDAFYLYLANVRAEERAKGFNASWVGFAVLRTDCCAGAGAASGCSAPSIPYWRPVRDVPEVYCPAVRRSCHSVVRLQPVDALCQELDKTALAL